MVLVKVLGVFDLISALSLSLLYFGVGSWLGWLCGLYLLIKGGIFLLLRDYVSLIDVFAGLFIFLVIYLNLHSIFSFVFVVWLLQKGVFSLA